ncbi:alpha/beta hydrolase [Winogradskyella sp.]|uniref:alpha/beta hydrolase n=1 Tax=Winogradskyella sp. TaxID=1883156 RepID=UPI0026095A54|nr:alpha/beta hydrolase [Winogradskyella sp.]
MNKVSIKILQTLVFICFLSGIAQSETTTEEFLLMNDSIQLPGTLTYNKNLEQQPLVIFVQGSGNPDRNGNQTALGVNANYIKALRDSLNKNNIAFYSYDKRNVTKANIPILINHFVFEDLVADVRTVIDSFKSDKRFNSITLLGHSQGSLVAMLAVSDDIDKYISLAGLGESVDNAITRQISAQSESLGQTTKDHFKELKSTGKIKEVNPMLLSIFAEANLDFLKSYMEYQPTNEISKLKIPTLIINGTKDIQVTVKDAEALHKANPSSKLVIIENMNHVLKTIEKDSDNLTSYSKADFPLSQELITVITKFITQQ